MESGILNRLFDISPLVSPMSEPRLLELSQPEAKTGETIANKARRGQKQTMTERIEKKWHDVSSTYPSPICRVKFVMVFVVVLWGFFVALLCEHRLVLSFMLGQATKMFHVGVWELRPLERNIFKFCRSAE